MEKLNKDYILKNKIHNEIIYRSYKEFIVFKSCIFV
jgi:hypothetical protein